jgi:hypothetical protein
LEPYQTLDPGHLNGYSLGRVDVAKLNFGMLALIPKFHGADDIKWFRPIVLINVIIKFIKNPLLRDCPLLQTAALVGHLIKDIHIDKGLKSLQEIVHETKAKKLRGVFLKIDSEKAYDMVN